MEPKSGKREEKRKKGGKEEKWLKKKKGISSQSICDQIIIMLHQLEASGLQIIEKRRRDRINNCLNELRRLVPAAFEKNNSQKLEKAEILQLTVEHLRYMHSKGLDSFLYDPQRLANDYQSMGYRECASEVSRYLSAVEGLDLQHPLRIRLLSHLQCYTTQKTTGYGTWPPYPAAAADLAQSAVDLAQSATDFAATSGYGQAPTKSQNLAENGNGNGNGKFGTESAPNPNQGPNTGGDSDKVYRPW